MAVERPGQCWTTAKLHWEIKGRFRKRVVLANVPSFRFSFLGNIRRNHPFGNHPFVNTKKGHWEIKGRFLKGWFWRTYPRSGFRSGGTSAKTTLLETTLLGSPENYREPPDVGPAPTALWRASLPRQVEDASLKPQPFPPTLPSSSPRPLGSFYDAQEGAAWAGVGEAVHKGRGGGTSKRHLGLDPHLGAFEIKGRKNT